MKQLSTIHGLVMVVTLLPAVASAQHEEAVAQALAPYWQRQAIVAVVPRTVSKAGAVELAAAVSVIPTDQNRVYVPVGGRLSYHLNERWGLQASLSYYLASNASSCAPTEQQQLRSTVSLLWAPAYGKVSIYGRIIHLELQLVGGGGVLRTAAPDDVMHAADSWNPTFHLGAALSFFAAKRFVFRLAYRQHLYLRPEKGLGWPAAFGLDVGVLLGGRR